MRESSGRRSSSKRPDSSCSSSVTSAWKRRPFLSTSTMSPGAMPLDVTPARRPRGGRAVGEFEERRLRHVGDARRVRGRRARDGARRPRPTRAGAARRSRARSVRTCDRASCRRRPARGRARRGARRVARARVAAARTARRRARSRGRAASRRAPRRRRAAPATGRKSKIPPPSLSTSTIVSARPEPARRPAAPPRSWASATSPMQQHDRAVAGGGDAEARSTTVPSMPFAPRLASTRGGSSRAGAERLDVADRHRGGDDQRRRRRAAPRRARAATRGSLELVAERRAIAARGRVVGGAPARRATPGRRRDGARRARRASARGSAASARVDDAAPGPARRPRGRSATCARVERRQPRAQRLGGRQVADAQHDVGPRARRRTPSSRSSAS